MGSSGLEPPTSRLSGARSNLLSYEPVLKSLVIFLGFPFSSPRYACLFGLYPYVTLDAELSTFAIITVSACQCFLTGDDGIRTHDPLLAGQVLSQLSYTPIRCLCWALLDSLKDLGRLRRWSRAKSFSFRLLLPLSLRMQAHSKLNNKPRLSCTYVVLTYDDSP